MNKTHILFVIHRLAAGGAEKSLVSLLNSLPLDRLEVDLMALDPTGIFRNQLPPEVNVINAPKELVCQFSKISGRAFWRHATAKSLAIKIGSIIGDRLRGKRSRTRLCHNQYYNEVWRKFIPKLSKAYDVVVSYIDGLNYYAIDHVTAKKKILWCHNDYNKLDFIASYDHPYYEKADKVCTISELCRKSLVENFPDLENKFEVVENISSPRIIKVQAEQTGEMVVSDDGFVRDRRFKMVSIGRLSEQKGFDYAIDAAKILKAKGVDFCWYILGEGPLRKQLEEQISANHVSECVKLVGVRSNPYPYIRQADIFVMPSRYEGKSIALDEAKILCKPIVVTNYPSVADAIKNGTDGFIVETTPGAIAEGLLKLYGDRQLRESFIGNLQKEDCGNEKQVVEKFLGLID